MAFQLGKDILGERKKSTGNGGRVVPWGDGLPGGKSAEAAFAARALMTEGGYGASSSGKGIPASTQSAQRLGLKGEVEKPVRKQKALFIIICPDAGGETLEKGKKSIS